MFGHSVTRSVMPINYFIDILARVEHSCLPMARSLAGCTLYGIFCVMCPTGWESVPKPSALWAWVKELHPVVLVFVKSPLPKNVKEVEKRP